ncbi:Signal transduction histidine kinase [Paenibacillus uliginis N3/975]|uniref:histidine kinase n=2 Tax=Paenibacillus TaxID=44249 RepID=A0A1X7HU15_9BACL|nr:Signal transduction histidine kinase [Paenibacillus uliginis N3/975]
MKLLKKMNINQKIFGVIIASLIFLASALGWIIWDSLHTIMTDELKKRGISVAHSIASLSSDYILMDEQYSIHQLISQAQLTNDDVRYILIINSSHDVVGDTFEGYLPKGIIQAHTPESGHTLQVATLMSDEGTIYDVLMPIEEGDVGFVRVGMTDTKAQTYINIKMKALFYVTLFICVVTAIITYYMTRFITRPINNLVAVATGISAGNLTMRASITNSDEVGRLGSAFNEMADKLINSNAEVELLLRELQAKEHLRDKLILKLLSAQEDEKKRISRELHDETSQALASLMVTMRILSNEAKDAEQQELLNTSRDTAASILREIRDLAVELRPPILDDMGLVPAIKKFVKKYEEKYHIEVELFTPDEEDIGIEGHIAVAMYRILQEGMTNVAKHSAATQISINMEILKQSVTLIIRDNGCGIQRDDFELARQHNRIGIYGMKERAELLGGSFFIYPISTGGTEIVVSIPLILNKGCNDGTNHNYIDC